MECSFIIQKTTAQLATMQGCECLAQITTTLWQPCQLFQSRLCVGKLLHWFLWLVLWHTVAILQGSFNDKVNKLIFLYLKTRCRKNYTSNTMYIKLQKLSYSYKKLNKMHKNLIPTKLTTIPYNTYPYNTIKYKHTL